MHGGSGGPSRDGGSAGLPPYGQASGPAATRSHRFSAGPTINPSSMMSTSSPASATSMRRSLRREALAGRGTTDVGRLRVEAVAIDRRPDQLGGDIHRSVVGDYHTTVGPLSGIVRRPDPGRRSHEDGEGADHERQRGQTSDCSKQRAPRASLRASRSFPGRPATVLLDVLFDDVPSGSCRCPRRSRATSRASGTYCATAAPYRSLRALANQLEDLEVRSRHCGVTLRRSVGEVVRRETWPPRSGSATRSASSATWNSSTRSPVVIRRKISRSASVRRGSPALRRRRRSSSNPSSKVTGSIVSLRFTDSERCPGSHQVDAGWSWRSARWSSTGPGGTATQNDPVVVDRHRRGPRRGRRPRSRR